ncbi:TonB-dependent receptor [Sphingomonas sp. CCH18-H6]|uniref:TonB-dependent receptor n=1 Tax=Sphingomonas sp. CCH18-H6 TaxID=1768787 RepID=UPI000AF3E58F|nr:TonB-dependent receptor [Sphingomonas sp. CCH18-H6]
MKALSKMILHGVALGALLPSAALAQAAAEPTAGGQASAEPSDIVVTARRREETLQDVPIAISAFSGDTLQSARVDTPSQLFGTVPSLYFTQASFSPTRDFTYLTLRGLGAQPALDPSVGIFVDGVYQPSLGIDLGFLSLERVEILRGPQGSLFGRNTLAGAINYVTRKPGDTLEARFLASAAEQETFRVRGLVSGPIGADLSASIAGQYDRSRGYLFNSFTRKWQDGFEKVGGRVSLLWNPSDSFSLEFAGDYTYSDNGEQGRGVPLGCRCYQVRYNAPTESKTDIYGAALTAKAGFGEVELTSITGVRGAKNRSSFDVDGTDSTELFTNAVFRTPLPVDGVDRRVTDQLLASQELRLQNTGDGAFNWLVGLYGFYEEYNIDRFSRIPLLVGSPRSVWDGTLPGGRGVLLDQDRRGYAVFGQASYKIANNLEFALGGRYSWERARLDADVSFVLNADPNLSGVLGQAFGPVNFPPFVGRLRRSFDGFTPNGSLTWKPVQDLTLYATVAKGLKAGGFQKFPLDTNSARPFGNEYATNYELGLKASAWDGRANISLAGFHIESRGMQLQTSTVINGVPVGLVDNAGSGRINGGEVELSVRPVPVLTLTGSASYLDTKFKNYVNSEGVQRRGDPFPFVPKWTASAGFNLDAPVSDKLNVTADGHLTYIDSYPVGDRTAISVLGTVPSYTVVNASLGVRSGRWRARVFAENLFDEYYYTRLENGAVPVLTPQFTAGANPNQFVAPGQPRRVGLEVSFTY